MLLQNTVFLLSFSKNYSHCSCRGLNNKMEKEKHFYCTRRHQQLNKSQHLSRPGPLHPVGAHEDELAPQRVPAAVLVLSGVEGGGRHVLVVGIDEKMNASGSACSRRRREQTEECK